jgi:hypothetical protein
MSEDMVAYFTHRIGEVRQDIKRGKDSRERARRYIAELCAASIHQPLSVRLASDLKMARAVYRELDDRIGASSYQESRLLWKLERARSQKQ